MEPLQIVSYTGGQKFDLHHDAGTIMEDGEIEIVQPRRCGIVRYSHVIDCLTRTYSRSFIGYGPVSIAIQSDSIFIYFPASL